MLGLIVGLLIFAIKVFILGSSAEMGLLTAAGFLWWWYLIWTIIQGLISAPIAVGLTAGGAALGSPAGPGGALFGAMCGGILSLRAFAWFLAIRTVLLLGTYLVSTSGAAGMSFEQFDRFRLIFGACLILVGVFYSRIKLSFKVSRGTAGSRPLAPARSGLH